MGLAPLSRALVHPPITVPAVFPAGPLFPRGSSLPSRALFSPRALPPSHARVRIHYFILLPFFPAPSLAGFLPSFFALRAPKSLPWQPYFTVFMPEINFFRMFFQKTSANIWWNGKVGVPLHPQTRKGHPCGAGAVTYARSASLVCAVRSLKD